MTPAREVFAKMVLDPANSPLRLIGAAVSYAKMNGSPAERKCAGVLDAAIKEFVSPQQRSSEDRCPWPPAEMSELLDSLARSADRMTNSYSETAHIARNAAKCIREMLAEPR
jgi:hypothetical protein